MHVRRSVTASRLVAPLRDGDRRVGARELREARAAIAKLPLADRRLLARHGLHVELVPRRSLEDGMLGATSIVRDAHDRWKPTRIRVAGGIDGRGAASLAEVVQHEVGHAVAVIRGQDRSEDAARRYARRW